MVAAPRRLPRRLARGWRWGVVLAGVVVLVSLPSIVAAWPVDDPDIATPTLLERIAASDQHAYEGLFESRGGVRVPDLGRYDDEVAMFTESQRVRVWYAAPDRWRADEITAGGETGWYREPAGLWRWRTGRQQVVFATRDGDEPARFPRSMDVSPPELGRRVVREVAAEPGSAVIAALSARRVAGRTAAGVRIRPADAASSTITSVDLWADPETGVVLRVEIWAGGSVPIFETGYLDVRLRQPARDVLTFDPDETGVLYRRTTTMDAVETLTSFGIPMPDRLGPLTRRGSGALGVQTYGSGLSIVTAFAAPRGVLGRRLESLPTSDRPWGGSAIVIEAGLVNVEIVDTAGFSFVLAGTVPLRVLDEMAAALVGAEDPTRQVDG